MKKFFIFFLIIAVIPSFISCSMQTGPKLMTRTAFIMDTYVTFIIPESSDSEKLLNSVLIRMEELEKKLDWHNPDSEIYELNSMKELESEDIDLITIINESVNFNRATENKFSILLKPVLIHWTDPGREFVHFPYDIDEMKKLTSRKNLGIINSSGKMKIYLDNLAEIDLGGIAKGYIVDTGFQNLSGKNIKLGLINAGGDIRVWGGEFKKSGTWNVGIQIPDKPQGEYEYIIMLKDGAVTTSGDYERFIFVQGKKFHHIIDPDTLLPSDHAHSVTVIIDKPLFIQSKDSLFTTEADALATALMCMNRDTAREFCNKNGIMALIYEKDMNVFISEPLKTSKTIKIKKDKNETR